MSVNPASDETARPVELHDLLMRLRRLEGQIRGIQRMVQASRSCDEIVTQLLAVRSAVDRVGLLLLSQEVEHCLEQGASAENLENLKRALRQLTRLSSADQPGPR